MSVITVTTTNDSATTGQLTLRQAVARAADGDTIVFAHGLFGGVELTRNLAITKSITIEGQLGNATLGGSLFMGGSQGSIIVRAGADVKIAHIQVVGGTNGAAGLNEGPAGGAGDNGTDVQNHGTDGGDGENGGKSTSPGFIGNPALINQGHLTLDHVAVSGSANGGSGRNGGEGGRGGDGGGGSVSAGDGGIGGDGGRGSNGASAVGGILNEGTLVLHDSALRFCFAEGGAGGDGGRGGDGGNGGNGGTGGTGGNGGAGGNGGSGGAGIAGILNNGTVLIEGAALSYGNSAQGGAGGAGGLAGEGGAEGHTGGGGGFGAAGSDGTAGATGSTGSGAIYAGAGPTGGSLGGGAFFEWLGVPQQASTISGPASGGTSFRDFTLVVPREGQITTTDTVHWKVSGAGLIGADFVGGALPGGTLTYAEGVNSAFLSFHFTNAFAFTGSMTFKVTLFSPSANTVLGSQKIFTETLYAATAGSDTLNGTAGSDQLDAGKGSDLVSGLDGADNLVGGLGRDTLKGGTGDDTLIGGGGKDVLNGGAGADRFIFYSGDSSSSSADRIQDFHHGQHDVIAFSFPSLHFIGTTAFGGTAGEIRYDSVGNEVHVLLDTNGDKVADSMVILTGLHTLVAADFGL